MNATTARRSRTGRYAVIINGVEQMRGPREQSERIAADLREMRPELSILVERR
jgi:hypothetical protein